MTYFPIDPDSTLASAPHGVPRDALLPLSLTGPADACTITGRPIGRPVIHTNDCEATCYAASKILNMPIAACIGKSPGPLR